MNDLVRVYLARSGYRYDPSTMEVLLRAFHVASAEERSEFVIASKAMTNTAFEKTVYWGIVSGLVLACNHNRGCSNSDCGSKTRLQVHHDTYEHRGEEHLHLSDLRLLCGRCHQDCHIQANTVRRYGNRIGGDAVAAMEKILGRGLPSGTYQNVSFSDELCREIIESRKLRDKQAEAAGFTIKQRRVKVDAA